MRTTASPPIAAAPPQRTRGVAPVGDGEPVVLHVVAPLSRKCVWINEYHRMAESYPGSLLVSDPHNRADLRAALAVAARVTILDCHGYRDGSFGNGPWARTTLDPAAGDRLGATAGVVVGACGAFAGDAVPDTIAALCAGRALTGGTGLVLSHHTRVLTRRLCAAHVADPAAFATPATTLDVMTTIHDELASMPGVWADRWMRPTLAGSQ